MLAVGGGSVIDGVKISFRCKYDGEPWDILQKGIRTKKEGTSFRFWYLLYLLLVLK